MDTHVYINNREACSKAADGKSAGAFPDPCWSPPTPPTGPVVIPYPNTAHAKNLSNGTCSVFIHQTMVAREDKSYFSTSEGDDGATQGLNKGVKTRVIKGKAYFQTWSMDVRFEGCGVPRHNDLMTHNHGSGANTPPHYYKDKKNSYGECKKDFEKVDEECKPDDDKDKKKKTRPTVKKLMGGKGKKHDKLLSSKHGTDNKSGWMNEHCSGLWITPRAAEHEKLREMLEDFDKDFEEAVNEQLGKMYESLKEKAGEKALDMAKNKGGKLAARAGGRWAVGAAAGGVGAVVTEGIATIWNIFDVLSTGYDVVTEGIDIAGEISRAKDALTEYKGVADELKRLKDQVKNDPTGALAQMQAVLAKLDKCLRYRKCSLVPYNKTGSLTGQGCCPGQTGHHLLPDAMFGDGACPGYNKDTAPTVCAEGADNSHGSHGAIHRNLKAGINTHERRTGRNTMTYPEARNKALESFYKTFPESMCSKKCLKAQLDAYYEKICGKDRLKAHAGTDVILDENF